MTYNDLANMIRDGMTEEQRQSDVTICTPNDEFYASRLRFQDIDDVLDAGHPYLCL